ncbi:MAG: P1 family peptidase [Actinobacteria bacterium]|nr:P1 family peptidase [Actinomycetota bacterium]
MTQKRDGRRRIREWMDVPGRFQPGRLNSITDVPGVAVGHKTICVDASIRTGVTVVIPHTGDVFADRCPAAVHVGNGVGKLTGALQVAELGELESVIALTNTLSVPQVMQGLLDHHLSTMAPGWQSINVVVGETNDGYLNDIRGCHVRPQDVIEAIDAAAQNVEEGCVGAGTGTCCFGYKGGIGTSSRVVSTGAINDSRVVNIGALVQSNYGGSFTLYGHTLPGGSKAAVHEDGSCMIVVATDAPLDSRQLTRIAKRAIVGLARTGSVLAHGSGDFCIAFSNHPDVRRKIDQRGLHRQETLVDDHLSALFEATADAVQEALYNSLTMAVPTQGHQGHRAEAFRPQEFTDLVPLRVGGQ